MTWTTYQTGDRGTVLCWHVGHIARDLAAALPGWTVRGTSAPTVPAAQRPPGRVVLAGYSLGCVGLRETLRGAITSPDAVVTIDGTHSSIGSAEPSPVHVALWRSVAERARRGELLWLATTLGAHRYTERLRPPDGPYASTGRVLERALDLADGALRTPQALDQGALRVRSYPSADIDTPAHAAQVREALPALWREVVVPYLAGPQDETTADGDTDPAPPPAEPPGATMRATIRLGDRGPDVEAWQRIIGATADGVFGPGTERLTRAWQKAHGLVADGVVGTRSWREAGETGHVQAQHGGPAPACRRAIADASARWPERRTSSDGIMGDASHQARPSDHNLGNAVDISHDPRAGCDGALIAELARLDPRTQYVIWSRRIWNADLDAPTSAGRPYGGDNPHTIHVHISIRANCRDDDRPWPWSPDQNP